MVAAMTELKKAGSGISTIIRVIDNIAFQIDRCRRSSQSRTPMLGRRARNRAVDRRYGSQERRRITHQRSGCRPDDGHHNPRARVEPTRRRISQACGQQSQGIHQIKQAVSQIESVTQSTAHNAERTATAAAGLKTVRNGRKHHTRTGRLRLKPKERRSCDYRYLFASIHAQSSHRFF
jgi:hypothetical protein